VSAIKNENITAIAWMYVTLYYCTAVHLICAVRCEDLAAEERIFLKCCDLYLYVCHPFTENADVDADESPVFAKDDNEEYDDWEDWASIFEKSGSTSSLNPAHSRIGR